MLSSPSKLSHGADAVLGVEPRPLTRAVVESPIGVMLLVSSLEHGGAERQVIELFRGLDRTRFAPIICCLADDVPLIRQFPDVAPHVIVVPKRWKYDLTTIARVAAIVRERRIDLIHSFLFDAEMAARAIKRLGWVSCVVASERNSDYSLGRFKFECLRRTSGWFDAMIANSAAGKQFNVEKLGISSERVHVIRNGVDVRRFQPASGAAFRERIGVDAEAPLVGMIASFKRQKRQEDFIRVAAKLRSRWPRARFVCVGEPLRDNQQGAEDYYQEVRRLADELGLKDYVVFAGPQQDMPAVYSACDVTVLPSSREGTPNAVLESMACGVPVIASTAGDNSAIVRDGITGFVVPIGDITALSAKLTALLEDERLRRQMGARARDWVTEEFSTDSLARRTEAVYAHALQPHQKQRSTPRGVAV
jgi:glycosyltransferase involved in cell wall biosynthesis